MPQEHNREHEHEHEHEPPEEPTQEPVGHRALSDALSLSFTALKVGMALLVVLYILQGFFFADPDEVKIKLRFGRPVSMGRGADRGAGYVIDAASGWHYAWPWEEVVTIPLGERSLEVREAFSPGQMGQRAGSPEGPGLSPKTDNYLITGDVNIIYVQLRARYRPRSDEQGALDYAFRMRPPVVEGQQIPAPPQEALRRLVIAATLETVSSWGVLDVRSKTREVPAPGGQGTMPVGLFDEIERRVRHKMERFEEKNGYTLGIQLTGIERIQDPDVPATVRQAFDMFQQAESQKQRLIDEGRKEANSITTNAEGRKAELVARARAYKNRVVSVARADAQMLDNLRSVYRQSPQKASILREWHYQRMIEELLGEAEGSFVLHQTEGGNERELWLQLGQPARKAPQEGGRPVPEE